jgi:hypothetical protein
MLEPTHVAPYPYMTSASSSPPQTSSQQRLPSITHVTSALYNQQQQPLSLHNMQQHIQIMPQPPLSSLPQPRQVLPPRLDSKSSIDSSTQGSIEYTPQPHASSSSSSQHPRNNATARRDSSASSSHTNSRQRRRPGGQTKAACLPCRKRKSKVRFLLFLFLREVIVLYFFDVPFFRSAFSPPLSCCSLPL